MDKVRIVLAVMVYGTAMYILGSVIAYFALNLK